MVARDASARSALPPSDQDDDEATEPRARRYTSIDPLYSFEQLVVPQSVMDDLLSAVDLATVQRLVFEEWGLKAIEPFPRTALNFHGPPGTGKTMAAHALANRLGRKILVASYAEIESKFHGDGPKNVKALFHAAQRDNSILFIDEADSLLSRRLTSVTQGSEQAINSMRSQLLICLEAFSGAVIFSTNLVENYDKAFETRVRHVKFVLPDEACRRDIGRNHLPSRLPVAADVVPDELAKIDDLCGRDIKNAVIDAAVRAALTKKPTVEFRDLAAAVQRVKEARIKGKEPSPVALSDDEKTRIAKKLAKKIEKDGAGEASA
jgi:ATP-dependent 26S proteasome regulatory subunit